MIKLKDIVVRPFFAPIEVTPPDEAVLNHVRKAIEELTEEIEKSACSTDFCTESGKLGPKNG